LVDRWRHEPPEASLGSRSVDFLKRTGRTDDLDFIFAHIGDLDSIFAIRDGEVHEISREESLSLTRLPDRGSKRPAGAVMEC